MDPQQKPAMPQPPSRLAWSMLAALGVIALIGLTAWLAIRYVDSEWQRDLRNWQVRLGIVSDSRYAAINGWLDGQIRSLSALADNPSLQLYATQISLAPTDEESLSIIDSQTE